MELFKKNNEVFSKAKDFLKFFKKFVKSLNLFDFDGIFELNDNLLKLKTTLKTLPITNNSLNFITQHFIPEQEIDPSSILEDLY